MDSNKAIEGRVAQILNDQELVINIGANNLVRKGMRFAVLAAEPLQITDPETEEVIGEIDREKVRVEAVEVHERISICATYETRRIGNTYGLAAEMAAALAPVQTVRATFKASSHPAPLSEQESFVKIGDRVKRISE